MKNFVVSKFIVGILVLSLSLAVSTTGHAFLSGIFSGISGNNAINSIDGYGYGAPESKISKKALEGMAVLGDRWAQIKLNELYAKDMLEISRADYQNTSWFNFFTKLEKRRIFKQMEANYRQAVGMTQAYEATHPQGGQALVEFVDEAQEKILEIKALFGDREAKAKLELLRAQREYNKAFYNFDQIPWHDFNRRAEAKKQLEAAEYRLKIAKANYQQHQASQRSSTSTTAREASTEPVRIGSEPTVAVPEIKIPDISEKVEQAVTVVTEDLNKVRQEVELAYRRYVDYLKSGDINPDKAAEMLKEYQEKMKRLREAQQR